MLEQATRTCDPSVEPLLAAWHVQSLLSGLPSTNGKRCCFPAQSMSGASAVGGQWLFVKVRTAAAGAAVAANHLARKDTSVPV